MPRLCVSRISRLVIGMVLIVLGVTQPLWVEVNAYGEGWYSGWQLRKAITIDATKVGSTGAPHTNFPVLINLTSDSSLAARAQADGDDILFTSSDGTTKLSHEIEKYGSSTGELVAWVKVPSLSSSSNTVLYMYYGNDAAASQQDATNVWDSNYKGVYHLKETSGTTLNDSTSNTNIGTATNGAALNQTGQINVAISLDGTDDYIEALDSPSLSPTLNLTISAWFKATSFPGGDAWIVGKYDPKAYGLWTTTDNGPRQVGVITNADAPRRYSATTIVTGQWYYVVGVFTESTSLNLYLNDALDNGVTAGAITTINDTTAPLDIGRRSAVGGFWTGQIDEVRISNSVRSAGWGLPLSTTTRAPGHAYHVLCSGSSHILTS